MLDAGLSFPWDTLEGSPPRAVAAITSPKVLLFGSYCHETEILVGWCLAQASHIKKIILTEGLSKIERARSIFTMRETPK